MLRWRPELDTEATASSVAALAEATAATAAATAAARVERRSGPPLVAITEDEPASDASAAPELMAAVAEAAPGVAAGDDVFSSAAVERGRWRPSTWNTSESAEPSTCSLSSPRFESRARSSLARSLLPLAPEDLDPGCARLEPDQKGVGWMEGFTVR